MKKYALAILFVSGIVAFASAQKNVIKLKPLKTIGSAVLGATPILIEAGYERKLIPALSAQLNVGFSLENDVAVPGFLTSAQEKSVLSKLGLNQLAMKSFSFTPAVRFYPGMRAPKGFFLEGYFKYTNLSGSSPFNYDYEMSVTDPNSGNQIDITYPLDVNYSNKFNLVNYGLAIGNQWLLAQDHLSIEIMWFGIGWGSMRQDHSINGQLIEEDKLRKIINEEMAEAGHPPYPENEPVPDVGYDDVANKFGLDVVAQIENIPVVGSNVEVTTTNNKESANISIDSPAPSIRLMNFSIGIAF